MKLTNKETGITFTLTPKEAADFFYMKDNKGQFINWKEEYIIDYRDNEISNFKFFLIITSLLALGYASIYLFVQFNY